VTVVLDTDVLIDYLRGLKSAVALVEGLEGAALATTAVNLFELAWGACKLGGGRLRDVQRLAEALTALGLPGREALRAGEEMCYLESLGGARGPEGRADRGYSEGERGVRDHREREALQEDQGLDRDRVQEGARRALAGARQGAPRRDSGALQGRGRAHV
jgi:predicted nucleic acid-binding protein